MFPCLCAQGSSKGVRECGGGGGGAEWEGEGPERGGKEAGRGGGGGVGG